MEALALLIHGEGCRRRRGILELGAVATLLVVRRSPLWGTTDRGTKGTNLEDKMTQRTAWIRGNSSLAGPGTGLASGNAAAGW